MSHLIGVGDDFSHYQQVGTSPLEVWSLANSIEGDPSGSNATFSINVLRAYPILIPRTRTADRMALLVLAGNAAGREARMGLYRNVANPRDLYPGALLDESAVLDCSTTGVKSTTISRILTPGLYWLAFVVNNASISFGAYNTAQAAARLGLPSTLDANAGTGWTHAHTYGALPDPYPSSSPSIVNTENPKLALRFSA